MGTHVCVCVCLCTCSDCVAINGELFFSEFLPVDPCCLPWGHPVIKYWDNRPCMFIHFVKHCYPSIYQTVPKHRKSLLALDRTVCLVPHAGLWLQTPMFHMKCNGYCYWLFINFLGMLPDIMYHYRLSLEMPFPPPDQEKRLLPEKPRLFNTCPLPPPAAQAVSCQNNWETLKCGSPCWPLGRTGDRIKTCLCFFQTQSLNFFIKAHSSREKSVPSSTPGFRKLVFNNPNMQGNTLMAICENKISMLHLISPESLFKPV